MVTLLVGVLFGGRAAGQAAEPSELEPGPGLEHEHEQEQELDPVGPVSRQLDTNENHISPPPKGGRLERVGTSSWWGRDSGPSSWELCRFQSAPS